MTVTAEQVQRYYDEQFLEPDREKYRDNVPKYEEEVLTGNLNAFYIPEGYRYIKNILLPYPDEIVSALGIIELDGKKAYTEARKAYFELADAAAAGEDLTEVKEAYDLKIAAVRALEEEYTQKEKEALPLLAETIASIRKQLADGISIDSLLKEYSLDQQQTGSDKPGGLYHPDSKLWPEEAHAVIGAMTEIGSLSEPYCDQQGVHLFYYAGDAPGGEAVLNAEEKDQLERSALYYYQLQRLKELISEWLPKYEVSVDFSLIRFDGR